VCKRLTVVRSTCYKNQVRLARYGAPFVHAYYKAKEERNEL
jgi:hypothetical protein